MNIPFGVDTSRNWMEEMDELKEMPWYPPPENATPEVFGENLISPAVESRLHARIRVVVRVKIRFMNRRLMGFELFVSSFTKLEKFAFAGFRFLC